MSAKRENSKERKQRLFKEQSRNLSDREIQIDLLYSQKLLIETMDKVRGNTNTLIWWLIVMPIVFTLIAYTLYEKAMIGY